MFNWLLIAVALWQFHFEVTLDKTYALPGERFTVAVLIDESTPIEFDVIPINATWDVVCLGASVVYACRQNDQGIIRVRLRDDHPTGSFSMPFHVDHNARCTKAGVIANDQPALLAVTDCRVLLPIIVS